MQTTTLRVFFFSLVPVGVFLLIKAIRLVKKSFNGELIHEVPYARKISDFEIPYPGVYSVWHKGQVFRKAPLDKFKPFIINFRTKDEIELSPSIFRPNTNNGRTGRTELFRFSAPAGKYRLKLAEGSSVSMLEQGISGLFPLKKVDPEDYFIQIRVSQPINNVLTGIPMIVLAGFLMIGGLVLGILADELISE
jgi:hypothetical protein